MSVACISIQYMHLNDFQCKSQSVTSSTGKVNVCICKGDKDLTEIWTLNALNLNNEFSHQSFADGCLVSISFPHISVFPFLLLQPFRLSKGCQSRSAGDLVKLVNNSSHLSPSTLITVQRLFPYSLGSRVQPAGALCWHRRNGCTARVSMHIHASPTLTHCDNTAVRDGRDGEKGSGGWMKTGGVKGEWRSVSEYSQHHGSGHLKTIIHTKRHNISNYSSKFAS